MTGYTSKTISPDKLKVTGLNSDLQPDQAIEIVEDQLGFNFSESNKDTTAPMKGIYLVGDNPEKGRKAFEISVPAGKSQDTIKVYLDIETRTILDIK